MADYLCACGTVLKGSSRWFISMHERSKVHKAWDATQAPPLEGQDDVGINLDDHVLLRGVLENKANYSLQTQAKNTRRYFGTQGWPNEEQSLSVAEFLEQSGVPTKG